MVKQIRDYVLEARQIRESKEQKNEARTFFGVYGKKNGDIQYQSDDFSSRADAEAYYNKAVAGKKWDEEDLFIELFQGQLDDDGEPIGKIKVIKSAWAKESSQKNEGLGPYSEVEKQLEKFKKYMYQNYKNHPGFNSERKEAIETVLDLLRELNEG